DTYGHLEVEDLREAMELLGEATGVMPDALEAEPRSDSFAPGPIGVQALPEAEKTGPGSKEVPQETRALVIGAEHRVRTGDLRLGKAIPRICRPMESEATLRNLSRHTARPQPQICQPMHRNAAALLTQD